MSIDALTRRIFNAVAGGPLSLDPVVIIGSPIHVRRDGFNSTVTLVSGKFRRDDPDVICPIFYPTERDEYAALVRRISSHQHDPDDPELIARMILKWSQDFARHLVGIESDMLLPDQIAPYLLTSKKGTVQ